MADNLGAAATSLAGDNSPASTPAATPSTPTPAANAEWYAALPPETLGLLEKKGWNNPNGLPNLIKSYSELEKQFSSSDKVILPKDEADTEGWGKFWAKLGRPENADAYRFPDGVDAAAVKALAPELHKLGITQKQAAALATLDLQRHATAQESERQRVVADQNAADADLRGEWGAKYNENVLIGMEAGEPMGTKIGVRLIAGLIARRIVPWVAQNDIVQRGERISLIQFGSRVDVYLPLNAKIKTKLGDRVVGGESILAELV